MCTCIIALLHTTFRLLDRSNSTGLTGIRYADPQTARLSLPQYRTDTRAKMYAVSTFSTSLNNTAMFAIASAGGILPDQGVSCLALTDVTLLA